MFTKVHQDFFYFRSRFPLLGKYPVANEILCLHSPSFYCMKALLAKGNEGIRERDKNQRVIESGQFSCFICLDLSKAIDTGNHDIVLAKLYSYGICGISYDWFVSCISNTVEILIKGLLLAHFSSFNTSMIFSPIALCSLMVLFFVDSSLDLLKQTLI